MRMNAHLRMVLAAAAIGISSLAATAASNENPALQYYQAFLLSPELSDEDSSFLFHNNWHGQRLPDRVGPLLARYDGQFAVLRQAAQASVPCDWGIDMSPGPATMLPHLARCKAIAQAARLRVQWHLQNGRQADACQDFLASFELGRNVSADGTLISTLVQMAIEAIHSSIVAAEFGRFTPESLRTLAEGMEAAPPRRTVVDSLEPERRYFLYPVRERIRAMQGSPGSEAERLASLKEALGLVAVEESPEGTNLWSKIQAQDDGTGAGVLRMLDELAQASVHCERFLAKPYAEYARGIDAFEKELESQNPFIAEALPAVVKARAREFRILAMLAMVRAAIEYKLHGAEGLNRVQDPCGNGPFAFERFVFDGVDRGFQLKSDFDLGNNQAVLVFVEKEGPPFQVDGDYGGRGRAGRPLPIIDQK